MSFDAIMPPYNAGDPHATFLNSSCFDFLLIELVPMAYRVTNELEAAEAASTSVPPNHHSSPSGAPDGAPAHQDGASSAAGTGTAGSVVAGGSRRALDEEEERDAVFYRLETLGYRVGQGLVERYVTSPLFFFVLGAHTAYPTIMGDGKKMGSRKRPGRKVGTWADM